MLPRVEDVLALPAVRLGEPVVRTGHHNLHRPVQWVHVSEVPWIAGLLEGGELILTTGIALPQADDELRRYVTELDRVGVCGVVVELGRRYRELPAGLLDAADGAGLPLVELRRETRFVAITQAVHTLILDARLRELAASDEQQAHSTLLTLLAVSPEPPPDAVRRAEALQVPLGPARAVTALVVRPLPAAEPALLRELATRAREILRALTVPAVVGVLDDTVVALLSQDHARRVEPVTRRLCDELHAAADHRRGVTLVIGAGPTGTGVAHAQAGLREAVRVADTAALLPAHRGWFRASDLRLPGLVHALRDVPALHEFIRAELEPLLDHDAAHGTDLTSFLAVFCRHGGNKTAAAAELFISRAALYDRVGRVERILGVDLSDPRTLLSLHVALLARDTLERPGTAVRAV